MQSPLFTIAGALAGPIVALMTIVLVIIHVVFALAVYSDATDRAANRRGLVLVGPAMWGLATLVTGVFGAVAYWMVHASTLAPGVLAGVARGEPQAASTGAEPAGAPRPEAPGAGA